MRRLLAMSILSTEVRTGAWRLIGQTGRHRHRRWIMKWGLKAFEPLRSCGTRHSFWRRRLRGERARNNRLPSQNAPPRAYDNSKETMHAQQIYRREFSKTSRALWPTRWKRHGPLQRSRSRLDGFIAQYSAR